MAPQASSYILLTFLTTGSRIVRNKKDTLGIYLNPYTSELKVAGQDGSSLRELSHGLNCGGWSHFTFLSCSCSSSSSSSCSCSCSCFLSFLVGCTTPYQHQPICTSGGWGRTLSKKLCGGKEYMVHILSGWKTASIRGRPLSKRGRGQSLRAKPNKTCCSKPRGGRWGSLVPRSGTANTLRPEKKRSQWN